MIAFPEEELENLNFNNYYTSPSQVSATLSDIAQTFGDKALQAVGLPTSPHNLGSTDTFPSKDIACEETLTGSIRVRSTRGKAGMETGRGWFSAGPLVLRTPSINQQYVR